MVTIAFPYVDRCDCDGYVRNRLSSEPSIVGAPLSRVAPISWGCPDDRGPVQVPGCRMTAIDPSRVRRCCEGHDSWQELTEHLIADYADVSSDQVITQVARAQSAVDTFGLGTDEQLEMAEVLARHQLMLLTGELPDAARLDPEVHVRSVPPLPQQ